jgi:hypothetical protein
MKSASVNVDANSHNEDSVDDKEKESVDEYSLAIGGEAAKFNVPGVPRYLE